MYAPNAEKLRSDFFKKVSKWISQYSSNDENIILVGDLNCDTASKKDKSSKLMQDIITKFSFIDLWSELNPQKKGLTWCDGQNIAKSRIDYVFFTDNFCYKPVKMFIRKLPNVSKVRLTDHLALIFKCEISDNKRGKRFLEIKYFDLERIVILAVT